MSWTYTTLKSAIQDYTQNTESTFRGYLFRRVLLKVAACWRQSPALQPRVFDEG